MGRVAIYHEVLPSIRGIKHRRRSELVLESLETFLTFVCPLKLDTFVKKIGQRLGSLGEVLDETAAIDGESEETSDLLDSLGGSPIQDILNTFWVDGNAILGNYMTKVGHFG